MKYYELSSEEKNILKDFEADMFVPAGNTSAHVKQYGEYARESLNKTRAINLRLSERDLLKLKARAAEKGIPYQTLVSSILHQYSNSDRG